MLPKSKVTSDSLSNINFKIGISFFILLFIIISLILSAGSLLFKKVIYSSEDRLAKSITNVLSLSINRISFSGKYHAQIFTEQLLRREQDLLYVIIADNKGNTVAKSLDESLSEDIKVDGLADFVKGGMSPNDYYTRYRKCCNESVHIKEIIMPYKGSYDRAVNGVIAVGISTGAVERELFKNNLILLLLGVSISFIGMVLIFLISNKISFPIRQLALTFQGILNHAPMSIVIRNINGDILESSKSFQKSFYPEDYDGESIKIADVISEKDLKKIQGIDEIVLEDNKIVRRELSIDGKVGKDYYTAITFSIEDVELESKRDMLCTLALNINEEKAIKDELERKSLEARKASEAKGNFLATMSHEIRTPLTSIIGFISLLKDSELTDEQKRYCYTALNSSESLLAIINDILDYSKIDSQELHLDFSDFSLRETVQEISEVFSFQVKEKEIHSKVIIDESIHDFIRTDKIRLRQILVNLVGNAVKFTSEGEVSLIVSMVEELGEQQWIRFEIRDTGIGLKPSQLEVIFDRFSQADNSISRKFGGTGLGLSICKQLVNLMDGKIWAESTYGEGANFIFTIPVEKVDRPIVTKSVEGKDEISTTSMSEKVILVADDEESNRRLIELFLKKLDAHVEFASNGQEALNLAKEKHFDLILMDVQMPEMDGVSALKHIREDEVINDKSKSQIYAFTANVFKEQLDRYSSEGFDGHFTKPFKKKDLIDFINSKLS